MSAELSNGALSIVATPMGAGDIYKIADTLVKNDGPRRDRFESHA